MLPGDASLGMPKASDIYFETYLQHHKVNAVAIAFVDLLDVVCEKKYNITFAAMEQPLQIKAINGCGLVDIRITYAFISHLFKAYYTSPIVLAKIGAGSIPPFPHGNQLEGDDWSILEKVYERGQIYRNA
jgi:hypothetical protein